MRKSSVFSNESGYRVQYNRIMKNLEQAKIAYRQYTLKNGLRVILTQDPSAPVVAVLVMYDVGSRNELVGKTGFAHLFEHMMFQGSAHVPREMHFKYVESNGGVLNGFTSQDCTAYFELLPSAKLPLGLWLEADRMRSLAVNQSNLDNQRDVVKEERRMGVDNQPYSRAREYLREIAYDNFANQHSVIGSMEDLDNATLEDVQEFFRTYYAPNNAVLVVSGDFDEERALHWIHELYEGIPSQPAPPVPDVSEPDRDQQKNERFEDALANVPALTVSWKIPARGTPENDALQIVADVLFVGRASRLYQRLVKRTPLAVSISGWAEARRGPGLFQTFILYKPDASVAQVEEVIYEEIERLAKEGLTGEELERVRTQLVAHRWSGSHYTGLESPLGRALGLAQATLFDGDPEETNRELERLLSVAPEQAQAVAKQYLLTGHNRTVMQIIPKNGH
jgi:zinc protease